MKAFLVGLWLALAFPALAALPHGSGIIPQFTSVSSGASATTINASWATTNPFFTSLDCGTSPGVYTLHAVNNGVFSQTSHFAIVAGLTASTTYFCKATSGSSLTFTQATGATPTSTPLINVTLGTPTVVSSGQNVGDTYYNATGSDGNTYVITDDTSHGWASTTNPSSNQMVGKISASFIGSNVNRLSNYGAWATCNGDDSRSPKIGGLFAYNNSLYATTGRQYNPNCPGYPSGVTNGIFTQTSGAIIKSADFGVTWNNFQTPGTTDANGSVTSPASAFMFASSTRCASASPVNYGPDNGTPLPTYRYDNGDAYAFLMCTDTNWNNGDNLWLARVPLSSPQDSTKVQYYIAGADGSLDAAWSSSDASISPILNNAGKLGFAAVQFMPDTKRYVMTEWYYPTINTFSATNLMIYEAAHPWGPWTLIYGPTDTGACAFYNPVPYQPSAITATANGNPMTLLVAGNFNNGTCYQLYTQTLVLNTH